MEVPTFQPRTRTLHRAITNVIDIWLFYIFVMNLQYVIWLWVQYDLGKIPESHALPGALAILILPFIMFFNIVNITLRVNPSEESIGECMSNSYTEEFLHSPFVTQFRAKALTDDALNPVGAHYRQIIDACTEAKQQLTSLEGRISDQHALHMNRCAQEEYSNTISKAWMKIREAGETTALEIYERDQESLAAQHQLIEQIATQRERI